MRTHYRYDGSGSLVYSGTLSLDEFMTPTELACYLGVSETRVHQLNRGNRIPVVRTKLGCLVRVEDARKLKLARERACQQRSRRKQEREEG
jgi:excisionase family DNA binding protein